MIIIRKIQIPGLPTKKPRRLYISLPRDYDRSDRRYPVLYMFDGHNVFYDRHATHGKSWGMREYLQKSKQPIIVVGIECNPEGHRRLSEYSPWDFEAWDLGPIEGRGRETMDWITGDLKSAIDAEFRTMPGREHTLIAGSSMGGLMAFYAAVAYNKTFSRAAALSPCLFLHPDRLKTLVAGTMIASPTRVYMDVGSEETEEHPEERSLLFEMAAVLSDAGAHVAAAVIPGAEHNEAAWEKRVPVFMRYLGTEE